MTRDTPRYWKPLVEADHKSFGKEADAVVKATMEHYSLPEHEARAFLEAYHNRTKYFVNDLYQIQVAPHGPEGQMLHINIRRRDGGMFKDWRHFQQIKNEIAGDEREAVEI